MRFPLGPPNETSAENEVLLAARFARGEHSFNFRRCFFVWTNHIIRANLFEKWDGAHLPAGRQESKKRRAFWLGFRAWRGAAEIMKFF